MSLFRRFILIIRKNSKASADSRRFDSAKVMASTGIRSLGSGR
jgi:hypothetical protein